MVQAFAILAIAAVAACARADNAYKVEFEVQLSAKERGTFVMEVHPDWAPLGAARFKELVELDFFKGVRFFRVISGFMAQFGISGNPTVAAQWNEMKMHDDPVVQSNDPYTVSFATSGKDSRTTQMFINFVSNANLDGMGFAPFAKVVVGTEVVDKIYARHGETPNQGQIQSEGNKYLKKSFPNLSYIRSAKILTDEEKGEL